MQRFFSTMQPWTVARSILQTTARPSTWVAMSVIGISLLGVALPARADIEICTQRTKTVKAGDWRTLESYWNATGHGYFRGPIGAEIKVLYGASIFSKDRQKQKLDGSVRSLSIGAWSATYARMQIKVPRNSDVTYLVCSGGIANLPPNIPF
jgi:hypothetical protein